MNQAAKDQTFKRLLDTLQMVLDAMGGNTSLVEREGKAVRTDVHELIPGEEGWRSVVRVRLLHGVARRRIMERVRHPGLSAEGSIPGYDFNADGYPINQEDLAATLSSFCTVRLRLLYLSPSAYTPPGSPACFDQTWLLPAHFRTRRLYSTMEAYRLLHGNRPGHSITTFLGPFGEQQVFCFNMHSAFIRRP